MNTLILLFHPEFNTSHANRALIDRACIVRGVEIVNMGGLYPDETIDLNTGVERLLSADRLVLQFAV